MSRATKETKETAAAKAKPKEARAERRVVAQPSRARASEPQGDAMAEAVVASGAEPSPSQQPSLFVELSGGDKHAALFPPIEDFRPALKALKADLEEVLVLDRRHRVVSFVDKLMGEPSLSRPQKNRILRTLAEVRESFLRLDARLAPSAPNKGYQIVNWKHTRTELDQVLEAAKLAELEGAEIEDALLASMFSDAVKTPQNFIIHNLDGAEAAVFVLGRVMDPNVKKNLKRLSGIAAIIREHQIGPPLFMATFLRGLLGRRLKELQKEDPETVASIAAKIARPLDRELHTPDGAELAFSAREKQLLALVGVSHWWVPHANSPWYGASRAVIDGDSLINYASPDGWAKIAALRGPDTQPFFEDATVFDSLQSAKRSYDDALSVVSPKAVPLAEAGLARTKNAIKHMRDLMRVWFASQAPWLPANPDGSIAFWNAPLKYPSKGPLSRRELEQFNFAKRIRERVVEILREEQNRY